MTTEPQIESPVLGLTVESIDQTGRIFFELCQRRVKGTSEFNDNQFLFDGLSGFWEWNGPALEMAAWYELQLTAKAKAAGPRTKPGSMYLDIRSAAKLDDVAAEDAANDPGVQLQVAQGTPATVVFRPDLATPAAPAAPGIPTGFPDVRGEVRGHVENLALRAYIAHVGERGVDMYATSVLHDIRQLRDRLYHRLTSQPIAPEHYCYIHEEVRWQSSDTGQWEHVADDVVCVEGGVDAPEMPLDEPGATQEEPQETYEYQEEIRF